MLPLLDESSLPEGLPEGDTTVTRTKDVALMVALDHRTPRTSTGKKKEGRSIAYRKSRWMLRYLLSLPLLWCRGGGSRGVGGAYRGNG